ncbi:MAG: hypothetical protein KDB53_07230, partial [Planctomycetes bacterium]|nr:hypothetical protein [Planctomycetota bacterium]
MKHLAVILLIHTALALPTVIAQEAPPKASPEPQVPEHDPAAVKLFQSMTAKVYKPINQGLKACTFQFTIETRVGDQSQTLGPYSVDWNPDSAKVTDAESKLAPAAVQQAAPKIITDLVGLDSFAVFSDNHFRLVDERTIKIETPKWKRDAATKGPPPFSHITLVADDEGRLGSQMVYALTGALILERHYDYAPHEAAWVITSSRTATPSIRFVTSYERSTQHGFQVLTTASTTSPDRLQTITYSHFKPTPPPPAPP